jgi:Spy/CpxP family protein refolding chaperone
VVRHHLGALALLAALALPLAASAQSISAPTAAAPAPAAQQRMQHRNPYMRGMRNLHLSDAQKQQIAGLMRDNRVALRKQIDGVLTPAQRTQLRANLAQARRHTTKPNGLAPQAPTQ